MSMIIQRIQEEQLSEASDMAFHANNTVKKLNYYDNCSMQQALTITEFLFQVAEQVQEPAKTIKRHMIWISMPLTFIYISLSR